MAASRGVRGYERYGWIILLVSAILGLLSAIFLFIAPNSILSDPSFQVGNAPLAIRLWGITWVGFNIFALVIILNNFRKRERWA